LTHTSWRGLRFGFAGSVAGAYKVFLPSALPLTLLMIVPADADRFWLGLAGLAAVAFNLMAPWTLGLAKCYLHSHYRYAHQQTRTWMRPSQIYALSFRAGFMGAVAVVLAGIVAAILLPAARGLAGEWLGAFCLGLIYFAAYVWVSSAFAAGLQNLAWSSTASEGVYFKSDLDKMDLAKVTLKNWLLMAFTLGLYRPFAAVATARLRLEAVTVQTTADIDAWAGDEAALSANAAGDFAGDFFGIDLGL
jgi:uncharacterized membrane protein YjgN (DUF898 family)